MYKYLLFDIDGTLLDFDKDKEYAFRKMYAQSGLEKAAPLTEDLMHTYDDCNMVWWHRFEQGLCTKPELFRMRFIEFFEAADLPYVDPDFLNAVYFEALGRSGTLYPGAEDMLRKLTQRYPVYVITNGNAASQATRLELSGLNHYIRACFISEAIGTAKPDKRYFDYVLSHIPGAAPENCLVIGDSLSSDMQGAHNAGMDSVWYNPKHEENTAGIPVTYEVSSFDEILRILL